MAVTGITDLYTNYATDVVKSHVESNTIHAVSRASIEREIMAQLDRAKDLHIDYKIAWYHAILETPLFDSLWYSLSIRHSLPPHTTERYTVQASLYEYEVLTSTSSNKPSSTKSGTATRNLDRSTTKATRKPNKAMRYLPPAPAAVVPPRENEASFADASNSPSSSSSAFSSSSSDEDEDEVDEEAAALGRSLYEHAVATTTPTSAPAPTTPTSKVVGGAGRIGGGIKTRPSALNKKPKAAQKQEEPGDGAYYAPTAANGRGGGARKGIDRKAGARGGKKGIKGKGGLQFEKAKGGAKVVKFAGLDEVGEGKENVDEVGEEKENEGGAERGGKRQRVPTEKAMLAKQ